MPHLDEGAIWVRATMPYTISFEEAAKIAPQIRHILQSFPMVTDVADEHGRPDDGTDPTGFFNVEFFVGLQPYREWTGPITTKDQLIAAIDERLKTFPGIIFNYTQPAEDAVDEAETGLKSALDVKVFGPDLVTLEALGKQIKDVMEGVRGLSELPLVQELGQPSLTIEPDRAKIARYGLNVADVNALIEAAVGGTAATQVVQGERLFDLVVRLEPQYRDTPDAIAQIPVTTSGGQNIPLKELADITVSNGAAFIYRQDNSRFIGVQHSVQGRDLAGAVHDAQHRVTTNVVLPTGYRIAWGRVSGLYRVAETAVHRPPADALPHFPDPVCALQQLQVPRDHRGGRPPVGPRGRAARVGVDGDAVLGLVRHRIFGAVRGLGADRRGLHLLRQRTPAGGAGDRSGYATGRVAAAATHHDDGARGGARIAAGGDGARRRHGLAASLCDGDRRGALFPPVDQRLRDARALRTSRPRGRSARGLAPSPSYSV